MEKLNSGLKVGTQKKYQLLDREWGEKLFLRKANFVQVPVFMKLYQVSKKIPERKMAQTWPMV